MLKQVVLGWVCAAVVVSAGAAELRWETPVMVSWTDDPATSVTLAWERKESAPARVGVRPLGDEDASELVFEGAAAFRHVFQLQPLAPNTWYAYTATSGDGFEESGRFWTAPADAETPFTFILYNDLQGGIQVEAANKMGERVAQANADFVISTGDLSDYRYGRDYDDAIQSWNLFFAAASNMLSRSVFQPVTGNHDEPENPDSFWHRLMELPGDKRNFSWDVGPIRFIGVDSAEFEVPAQTPWLARELQRAAFDPAVQFVVPLFHRPPFSWGERGGQGIVQEWWVPLFTKYEADLVLSGHAHTYQRTRPIGGVDYLVSAGAGGWLYQIDATRPEIAFATSCYHYAAFTYTNSTLQLAAVDENGHVFDRAVYVPQRAVRVEPVFPIRGETCTITYNPAQGPLKNAESVFIHLGRDEFNHVYGTEEMTKQADGTFTYTFPVPRSPKWKLAFCFRDGSGEIWDNNHKQNWEALLARDW